MGGCEYGVLDNQGWCAFDPGVTNGKWFWCGGVRVVMQEIGTGGDCWLEGKANGMRNCHKVSCMQKFPFATLAMLIAISMLATHTWCAIVGLHPSSSKFVDM